jgi:hypothetical protein
MSNAAQIGCDDGAGPLRADRQMPIVGGSAGDLAAEKILKRAATVATRQTKRRNTEKVPENSLKIETPRQSFCKISRISIYRPADRLADHPFISKRAVCPDRTERRKDLPHQIPNSTTIDPRTKSTMNVSIKSFGITQYAATDSKQSDESQATSGGAAVGQEITVV